MVEWSMFHEHEEQDAAFAAQTAAHAKRGVIPIAVWSGEHIVWLSSETRDALSSGDYLFVLDRSS